MRNQKREETTKRGKRQPKPTSPAQQLSLMVTAGNGAAAKTNFETAFVVRSGEMKPIAAKCLSRQQNAKRTPAGGEVTTN